MAGKPAEPPARGRSPSGESRAAGEQQQRGERAGALAIARHVKDDGRALILYAREEREHT